MKITVTAPQYVAGIFDRLVSPSNIRKLEVGIIQVAVVSFILHLGFLFFANHRPGASATHHLSYLKAIFTPFSFILFYEVILLVIILPKSMSEFIGKQFEIITFITLRSFFHDIGDVSAQSPHTDIGASAAHLGQDLIATIVMCALTVTFHRLHERHRDQTVPEPLKKFVDLKKTVAMILLLVLLATSILSLNAWIFNAVPAILGHVEFLDPNAFFYADFFSTMIIADVFLLIISMLYDSTFYGVVRNASFVISTILLRLSIGAERPSNHLIAISAFVFSIAILLTLRFRQKPSAAVKDLPLEP